MSQRSDWHSWHRRHVHPAMLELRLSFPCALKNGWRDDVLVVSLQLCLNLGQLAWGSLALPLGEVQSLKLPSSPRRYALKVSQNAHTIRTHSVEPNCKRQEIPSKCVRRRWNAVCKQWILSVVHLSSFLDAIIADLGTFLWFSGCSRRPLVCLAYWQMGISSHSPFCTIPYTISEFGRSSLVCIRLGLIWMNMFHTPDTRPPWI